MSRKESISSSSSNPQPNDDEISNGNTEDSLLSSTSRETITCSKTDARNCRREKTRQCFGHWTLVVGTLLSSWGVATLLYKPYDMFLDQRIIMLPGFPPYEWWLDPPEEVLLKVYVFNVTNADEFLDGSDRKLKLAEIGPIIYREKLTHTNPTFNENGTFTYTANRTAIYLPEMNTIDLNSTIVMPNLGVLLIPSYFYDAPFFTKIAINLMMRSLRSHPFIKTTIHEYLWNVTDPLLALSQKLAPNLVPTRNVGILDRIYSNFVDNVTVYIGSKFSHRKFFLIDKYDGSEYLPSFGAKCRDKVANSSEGVSYPQYLTKNDTLRYWRKSLCRVGHLHYAKEVKKYGVDAYRYELAPSTYDRTNPAHEDCYQGTPRLPNGLADASPCYFGIPVAASFPHYLYGDDIIRTYVEGLTPDVEKHGSYVIVEPTTGIPLHGIARSQSNLIMKSMRGFNEKIQRFSDLSIPLVWLEYNQVGIPWYINWLIYFVVVLLPRLQYVFTAFLFGVGALLIAYYLRRRRRRRRPKDHLIRNKTLTFESDVFLKPT